MSADRFHHHLEQMRGAAHDAVGFVEKMEVDAFLRDRRTQYAVAMCLVVIGEQAKQVMDECPEQVADASEIQWHKIRGMRNQVAHGYFDLDFLIVWDTVKSRLPELMAQIDVVLAGKRG